jgi:hypothetical protein
LDTAGNGKPYLLQIDQCDSKVKAWKEKGELMKGTELVGFSDCTFFFAARNSSIGREILRTCPIGSSCHIETSILGDSGIPFIVNIERINTVVYAKPFNYLCKVNGKTYPLRVDENKNVLEWRGKKYSIVFQPDCAKYGWHAKR